MSGDKKNVGKPDRERASGNEKYEVDYVAKKHGLYSALRAAGREADARAVLDEARRLMPATRSRAPSPER